MKLLLPRKTWGVLFLLTVILLLGSYLAFRKETERRKGLIREVPANITKTDVRRSANPDTGQEQSVDVIVSYEYEVNGQIYERTTRMSKTESLSFIPWGKAKVCYDPDNPKTIEDPQLFPNSHECGK